MVTTAVLSTREARFVQEYLVDACGTQAAIRAGVAPAGAHVWASRALRKAKVSAAIQARQTADAARLLLRREDVLNGLQEAINQAREQGNPAAMISGLREIGKMLGFYAVETKRVEVSTMGQGILGRMELMSDAELLGLLVQEWHRLNERDGWSFDLTVMPMQVRLS
jgi:phage terminase small subunit